MRFVTRPILFLAVCSALGVGACAGSNDDGGSGSAGADNPGDSDNSGTNPDIGDGTGPGGDVSVDPAAPDHTYVVDAIDVPENQSEVAALGLNVDGSADGSIDNALGRTLVNLAPLLMVDLQAVVTEQIDQGGIILLANLKASDIIDAVDAALFVFLGDNPNPAACENAEDTVCRRHLDGNGTFDIAEASPQDASIAGQIAQGAFTGGPGEVTIQISLSENADPLQLTLISARTEVNVAANGLSEGKLGGAVTMDNLFQALAAAIAGIIAADPSCTLGPPECCAAGTAKTILNLLDTNPLDCQVTADELRTNALVNAFVRPDMDLLNADGEPVSDGTLESISLGIGFDAVPGTFTPPASP